MQLLGTSLFNHVSVNNTTWGLRANKRYSKSEVLLAILRALSTRRRSYAPVGVPWEPRRLSKAGDDRVPPEASFWRYS